MLWFEDQRIPPGKWPFLRTTYIGLSNLEESLKDSVDLSEGNEAITITGCLNAYRQAILIRTLDLAQSVVVSWNAGQIIGSVICARALLETLAVFHSLLNRAQAEAEYGNWEAIGKLVDGYAFSKSPSARNNRKRDPDEPPPVGRLVRTFIEERYPGNEKFWDQICEEAHPNGERMMSFGGVLQEGRYDSHVIESNETGLFPAIYNCIYSCCWLNSTMLDFDILCEHIRTGAPLSDDHHLIQDRVLIERVVESVLNDENFTEYFSY
ncbi:MAG: hypothetical protein F4Y85_07255 [Gammaproteobacteria bacterium]|nr:hypothetical protein [Gammaproteobacteria bacterium]